MKLNKKIFISFIVIIVFLFLVWLIIPASKTQNQQEEIISAEKRKVIKPPQVYVFFKESPRNYQNIQFGDLRKDFDEPYNRLADELSDAYYNFWKKGKSKPFQGYDVQLTPEQSKELFDKLHGLIWHWYNVNFHRANLARPPEQRIPENKYNYIFDAEGRVLYKKSERSMKIIEDLKKQGIQIEIK